MANGDNKLATDLYASSSLRNVDDLNLPNRFKINGFDYFCFFEISPNEYPEDVFTPEQANQENKIRLTKAAIVNLDIIENVFEPFVSGHITLNNPFDYIEDNHFTRGDGTDYLHVRLCEWETYFDQEGDGAELALEYTFVLVDENNSISKTDRSNNFKTYALLDKNYAKLNRQIPYGVRYPKDDKPQLVGDIIKEVLKDGLDSPVCINEQIWHSGDHLIDPNGLFCDHIYSPLNWKYSDLLKYLLRINYALSAGEKLPVQTLLRYDRIRDLYTLEAIDDIFAQNKALTIEGFGLGDLTGNINERQTGEEGDLGTNKNNPVDEGSKKTGSVAPINSNEGMLKNANLTTPMLNYGNEFFVNYLIGHFSAFPGTFAKDNIVFIKDIIPQWEEAFVKVFKSVGGEVKPFLPISEEGENTTKPMSFPALPSKDVRNIAKAQLVSNLTFLNLQLTLDTLGETSRKPGRFIDVFKLSNPDREAFSDSKMLGRWFITGAHHRFFKDSYENVIMCSKTYIGPDKTPAKTIKVDSDEVGENKAPPVPDVTDANEDENTGGSGGSGGAGAGANNNDTDASSFPRTPVRSKNTQEVLYFQRNPGKTAEDFERWWELETRAREGEPITEEIRREVESLESGGGGTAPASSTGPSY